MRGAFVCGVWLGIFATLGSVACGRAADPVVDAPRPTEPSSSVGSASEPALSNEPVGEVKILAQGVSLFFPGAGGFVREDSVGSWTTLKHARTGATLAVLHRLARRTVTPAECEQGAGRSLRLLREPLVELTHEGIFRARDYFGSSVIGLAADGSGRVVVHAAGLARCLSLVFWQPKGEPLLLDLVSEKFFPTVRALSVDDRVRSSQSVEPVAASPP